jgi:choline dehydrogenase-like flavoprotein
MYKVSGVKTLNTEYANLFKRALMAAEYAVLRTGPMTMAPSQVGIFAKSSPEFATANLEFHVQPLSLPKFGEPLHRFGALTLSVCNLRPTSRGTVRLSSLHPGDPPAIALNYLSTEEDRRVAVDSIRLARRIAAQAPLGRHRPEEFLPGPEYQSDEELVRAAGEIGTTIFHPVGTVAMGRGTTAWPCWTSG